MDISPPDDSVDANDILITGFGTINDFGECPHTITKQITFQPDAAKTITLTNSAMLKTLLGTNRVIGVRAHGTYQCDGNGNWTEISFSNTGTASLEARMTAVETRATNLETAMTALTTRVTNLETRMTSLEARVTTLEGRP